MKKSKKVEMITLAEMTRLAGVSKPAATAFIHRQEESGADLVTISGRRTKTVNRNNPVVLGYIQNKTAQPSNRAGGVKSPEALRKLKNSIEKIELQTAALRDKYVDREIACRAADKFFELNAKHLTALPDNICRALAKELGVTDKKALERIKDLLAEDVNRCLGIAEKLIGDFKKAAPVKHGDNKPPALPAK
jgi:thiazole synthase ThiGH ThiG subunit